MFWVHIYTGGLICRFKEMFNVVCVYLQETLENVKKCRNFLSTLIKLASSGKQSSETTANVKELVKNLLVRLLSRLVFCISLPLSSSPCYNTIFLYSSYYRFGIFFLICPPVFIVQQEAKIEPEDFTSRLYQELNSSPQPYLVPFLKVRSITFQEHTDQMVDFACYTLPYQTLLTQRLCSQPTFKLFIVNIYVIWNLIYTHWWIKTHFMYIADVAEF